MIYLVTKARVMALDEESQKVTALLSTRQDTSQYTRGMKEELGLYGDQLNYITATFWASYCTFMIPAWYFLTRYPANRVLPALEIGWGLSTFGLAWARNIETLYAMRFLTGVFECCSFTGTIYIIGSWYKPGEIGCRVALFFYRESAWDHVRRVLASCGLYEPRSSAWLSRLEVWSL
ncbi:major facilitator superfamily domain-containing protein [Hypoxylon cercidicola]|nr:major facilitator superfamily domain-containing protein [Hypoxylon cercidicola]